MKRIRIEVRSAQPGGALLRHVSLAEAQRMIEVGEARPRDSRSVRLVDLDRAGIRSPTGISGAEIRAGAGESGYGPMLAAGRKIRAWGELDRARIELRLRGIEGPTDEERARRERVLAEIRRREAAAGH